jgi:hypothetical protein
MNEMNECSTNLYSKQVTVENEMIKASGASQEYLFLKL